MNVIVHHLQFSLQALTLVHLGPQAGAQIRGALWAALKQFACTDPAVRGEPEHSQYCPMCRLMALETQQNARGANPPRPFAVRPPLGPHAASDRVYYAGDTFTIGVNLFGDATDLFPYICQAFYRMGEIGLGYGRGRFVLTRVEAVDPFSRETMDVLRNGTIIAVPGLPVTSESIQHRAQALPPGDLWLDFRTPTVITYHGQRLTRPAFDALIARLLERCQAVETLYGRLADATEIWRTRYLELTACARDVRLVEDRTRWINVQSGSRRTDSRNSISGFVGLARFEGDLSPFLEWLLWGQSLHLGKNAVKGNGWYEVYGASPGKIDSKCSLQ